jgi:hypothetical protein
MLFRSKTGPIPLSPLFTAESLISVAEVLTTFSLLFMITALVNFIGKISAAPAIMTDCLCTNGYLTFPGIKALQ